ncbi:Similar to N-acetyltransferase eso1; acc. no. O42917 [Pyronema omphalodes CBS 100304]|uniref:Similar to N-acetyltransferase eso1 acc. no. O42917 n=1 Tax=Pyronema omphalodes (strain CBS 100304) TaxID=1076935 RepID=U4L0M5_PYROM|nr:Similar to N-acetyltransferase eso1; acc. no. O42917 [Pyronema omphalodes CBS 100304]
MSPRSRYTYRDLTGLSKYSVNTPLRAQCEMKRLGVDPETPLAVQQWRNLIAVNYPARAAGVTRHISGVEALKICPEIKLVHVATWAAGSTSWSYSDSPDMANSKSCLDPYRGESKKILAVLREVCKMTEKASIDESFLDLSGDIYERLIKEYPQLREEDREWEEEYLPMPPRTKLEWHGSHLVEKDKLPDEEEEEEDVDWDDVVMSMAAQIVADARKKVFDRLGYTCSAGIASNKMMAKLGAGYKKPNQQTVVRPSAVQPFLATFKFTKIRNLGGKLGIQISEHFKTESLTELLDIRLPQFFSILPEDTATYVYHLIRGQDFSVVSPQTLLKSMLSAKSFQPPHLPNSIPDAQKWLQVFISDIYSRLQDEGVMEGKRRPKTMAISFTPKIGQSRSKIRQIPGAASMSRDLLVRTAEGLLRTVVEMERGAWPAIRMSLQVGGFEEREEGNMGIGGFLLRGDAARNAAVKRIAEEGGEVVQKKRKVGDGGGIGRFFTARREEEEDYQDPGEALEIAEGGDGGETTGAVGAAQALGEIEDDVGLEDFVYKCPDCQAKIPIEEGEEHRDWHFAKSLEIGERKIARPPSPPRVESSGDGKGSGKGKTTTGTKKKAGKKDSKVEKGQRKLMF